MWPSALSGRLPIVALVGRYPANWLIGRGPSPGRLGFPPGAMRLRAHMGYYQPFPAAVPLPGLGCPRVTHPSATKRGGSASAQAPPLRRSAPFDLHVLGTPPAFVLSQDQTLELEFIRCRPMAALVSESRQLDFALVVPYVTL